MDATTEPVWVRMLVDSRSATGAAAQKEIEPTQWLIWINDDTIAAFPGYGHRRKARHRNKFGRFEKAKTRHRPRMSRYRLSRRAALTLTLGALGYSNSDIAVLTGLHRSSVWLARKRDSVIEEAIRVRLGDPRFIAEAEVLIYRERPQ